MALNRADIEAAGLLPTALKKTVPFAPLGGDVVLHGLLLEHRFANTAWLMEAKKPQPGETDAEAASRTAGAFAARVLAQAAKGADGQPLLTLAEWQALSASHGDDVFALANVVFAMSGDAPEEVAKN